MDVTIYTVEDDDGTQDETAYWWPFEVAEAKEYARNHGYRLIANEYEYSDQSVVADYTPGGRREGR